MRTALTLLFLLLLAPAANAASVAYITDGEVWLSSLDGTQKVKLAGHVTNASGAVERWNAVAQADNGRIVAVRNDPTKTAALSTFQAWEPNGTSTVQGPLNNTGGYFIYAYPVGFDLTADGSLMAYGFSNSGLCCPISYDSGTYVRPVTNSPLPPLRIGSQVDPTIFGTRVIAHTGQQVNAQQVGATTFGTAFNPWFGSTDLEEVRRTDVAANGQLAALELDKWTGGTKTTGRIVLLSTAGVDQNPTGAINCDIATNGVADDASLSQDAAHLAWSDEGGVKVAGTPATNAEPCPLRSPVVVIAPSGSSASIGPADVATFLPPPPPPVPPVSPPPGPGAGTTTTTPTAPSVAPPAKVTRAALSKGLAIKVQAIAAGKVTLTATVPAKALGKKGKPIVVATGSGTARAAGTISIKLKLNATGRKQIKRLKGKKATLRVAQGARSTTRTITLR